MKKLFLSFRAYLLAILVVGILLIPEIIFAQSVTASTAQGSDTLKALAELSGVIIEILTFLALLMLNFFGDLLGTDMITGKEAMEAIQPMWMWVRNLTNIMFVGVLLFLAFSNLFSSLSVGGEVGKWTIKEKLPNLIIAIIAINFSLLGFKVVIDAINVGTVAILGIADSRLEPDMNGLKKTLTGSRSWIKIDETRKDEIQSKISEPSNFKELTSAEVSEITVKSGIDCTNTWNSFLEESPEKTCDTKGCAVVAKNGGDWFVCRGFTEAINDMFCRNWIQMDTGDDATQARRDYAEGDDKCVFMMQPEKFETILEPGSEPGQNLFAAFGSVFMHLERLPALGAEINSLGAVVTNTLFSAILSIAFIVALVAVFIAMIGRVIVLWIALVFSPLLVGASILGVDGGKGGEISEKIITHLIMPLKVAAAFSVGFVMMSAMIEWHGGTTESTFIFGPALSQLGIDEFGFLWQIATIVIFWMVAFWAVDNTITGNLIKGIQTSVQMVGEVAAKSLTIDRPMFSVGTGENKSPFSLGSVLQMPTAIKSAQDLKNREMYESMTQAFNLAQSSFERSLKTANPSTQKEFSDFGFTASSERELFENRNKKEWARIAREKGWKEWAEAIESSSNGKELSEKINGNLTKYGLTDPVHFDNPDNYGKKSSNDPKDLTDPAKPGEKTPTKVDLNIDNNTATVGGTNITSSTSMQEAQNAAGSGVESEDIAKSLLGIINKSATVGAAIPVVSASGIQTVAIVDKDGNQVNWAQFGNSTNVQSLNKETNSVNFAAIYRSSNSLVQGLILEKLKSSTEKQNLDWNDQNREFKEKKK